MDWRELTSYAITLVLVVQNCMIMISADSLIMQQESRIQPSLVENTTELLNSLLDGYDKRLRPGFGGPATIIDVNMNIRSMGPISEREMAYQLDCYFRQSWIDKRLQFRGPMKTLVVGVNILERLWKPDTHFFNGQRSYLHTVSTPNKLLRIHQNGRILYSMRLTIKASCPMYLRKFPMDIQICPLRFGSHGYDMKDLEFVWTHGANHSIKMAADMRLSQYDLIAYPSGNETITDLKGTFSMLYSKFILKRHMGYFMINVYVPSSLLVILSWVAFWINREATSDRISLGITTVLTMTFLAIENRNDLPKVSYSTALDIFVSVNFVFVLATVLQFAGVHYFTKHGSGEELYENSPEHRAYETTYDSCGDRSSPHENEQRTIGPEERTDDLGHEMTTRERHRCYIHTKNGTIGRTNVVLSYSKHSALSNDQSPPARRPFSHMCTQCFNCILGSAAYRYMKTMNSPLGVNSVSRIDRLARVLFPLSFFTFNIFYWTAFLDSTDSAYSFFT